MDTAAEILVAVGDNPSESNPKPPWPNAVIYRTVIARMQFQQPTIDYVTRRTAEGKTKREIIRCLERYVIREIYRLLRLAPRPPLTAVSQL